MLNFSFSNPTKIHFGEQQIALIKQEIPADAKVLVAVLRKMVFMSKL